MGTANLYLVCTRYAPWALMNLPQSVGTVKGKKRGARKRHACGLL